MATQNVDVTTVPVDLAATLSLMVGTAYTLQNVDPSARIFLRVAARAADWRGASRIRDRAIR